MCGQLAPKRGKSLDLIVAAAQLLLVGVAGVHVDLDGEAVRKNCIHGAIQAGKEIRTRFPASAERLIERVRIDAQPHVIEAELRHQGNVLGVSVAIGVRRGVICRLREPLRSIDAVAQVVGTGKRRINTGAILAGTGKRGLGAGARLRHGRCGQHNTNCNTRETKAHPYPPWNANPCPPYHARPSRFSVAHLAAAGGKWQQSFKKAGSP